MNVIIPGHRYELANFERRNLPGQSLQFIQKEEQGGAFITVADGTTNEEVLEMLIDRLGTLYHKLPSKETELALINLRGALSLLMKRTQDRKARNVLGTPNP